MTVTIHYAQCCRKIIITHMILFKKLMVLLNSFYSEMK